jgi:2-dehydropantoate 2-reductase
MVQALGQSQHEPDQPADRSNLDRIIADPLAHTLCFRMMEEASRIGEAIGIPATVSIEEMFDRARALGAAKTSMLQDAEHGKPVEIDALLTVTRDLGRIVGVPTPFIDSVLGLARLKATSLGQLDKAA